MNPDRAFAPKLFESFARFTPQALGRELKVGVVLALFTLPVSMAFGTAIGLGPGAGLLTSIVAGFLAALLGGSRVQVTGPTAAFLVVSAGILGAHGVSGLVVALLLAGVLMVAFGFLRLGPILRFLPQPILIGFTAGIALSLVVFESKDVLGLTVANLPADLVGRLAGLGSVLAQTNPWAVLIAALTAGVMLAGDRWASRWPWSLMALGAASVVTALVHLPVPTLGSAVGPLVLPWGAPDLSAFQWGVVVQLLPAAFTLAFLGSVESLLSASVADGLVADRHRPNTELIAQGVANIASALAGGQPATGALGRTNVSVRFGGRTPLAAMVHSLVLLGIALGLGWTAAWVPVPALAGIVVAVALRMTDYRELRLTVRATQSDRLALLTTLALTVLFDLAFAVISGLLVAFFFFVRDMAQSSHTVEIGSKGHDPASSTELPPGTKVLDLNGAFFFGAAGKFEEAIRPLLDRARTLILRLDDVNLLDASGTRVLHRLLADAQAARVRVVFCEVQPPVLRVMEQAELINAVGPSNLFASFEGALRDVRNKQPLVFSIKPEEGCFDPL